MAGVQFYKYSAYGNTFVVLDESLEGPVLSDEQKSSFAPIATDEHGGIGADNLLVIQRFTPELMREIQEARSYWSSAEPVIDGEPPEWVFRMFEPDGSEALCCGNGLLCIAKHMFRLHQIQRCRMLTEVPAARPRVREIATLSDNEDFQHEVRIGAPRAMPSSLMDPAAAARQDGVVSVLDGFEIARETADARLPSPLTLSGYLTYTGEPHLVILAEDSHPPLLRDLYERIMGQPEKQAPGLPVPGEKAAAESQPAVVQIDIELFQQLGLAVNQLAKATFPQGINISFARLRPNEQLVEYRCFERGIFKETLACGTAAVAIAVVLASLKQMQGDTLTFWPKRSRGNVFYSNARIQVSHDDTGAYWLRGQARRIFEATLRTSEYPDVGPIRPRKS